MRCNYKYMAEYPQYIRNETAELAYERAKNETGINDPDTYHDESRLYAITAEVLRTWDTENRNLTEYERVAKQNNDDRQPYEIANDMFGRDSQRPYPPNYGDLQYKLRVRAPLTEHERWVINDTPDWLLELPDDYDPTEA